mmetsp:Transcript_4528/g.8462  ORF Transcript_4528/g.8462 Transcript_4528/m.8462 type:complete len:282 (+) Transcript_4528:508-1353(+)
MRILGVTKGRAVVDFACEVVSLEEVEDPSAVPIHPQFLWTHFLVVAAVVPLDAVVACYEWENVFVETAEEDLVVYEGAEPEELLLDWKSKTTCWSGLSTRCLIGDSRPSGKRPQIPSAAALDVVGDGEGEGEADGEGEGEAEARRREHSERRWARTWRPCRLRQRCYTPGAVRGRAGVQQAEVCLGTELLQRKSRGRQSWLLAVAGGATQVGAARAAPPHQPYQPLAFEHRSEAGGWYCWQVCYASCAFPTVRAPPGSGCARAATPPLVVPAGSRTQSGLR